MLRELAPLASTAGVPLDDVGFSKPLEVLGQALFVEGSVGQPQASPEPSDDQAVFFRIAHSKPHDLRTPSSSLPSVVHPWDIAVVVHAHEPMATEREEAKINYEPTSDTYPAHMGCTILWSLPPQAEIHRFNTLVRGWRWKEVLICPSHLSCEEDGLLAATLLQKALSASAFETEVDVGDSPNVLASECAKIAIFGVCETALNQKFRKGLADRGG